MTSFLRDGWYSPSRRRTREGCLRKANELDVAEMHLTVNLLSIEVGIPELEYYSLGQLEDTLHRVTSEVVQTEEGTIPKYPLYLLEQFAESHLFSGRTNVSPALTFTLLAWAWGLRGEKQSQFLGLAIHKMSFAQRLNPMTPPISPPTQMVPVPMGFNPYAMIPNGPDAPMVDPRMNLKRAGSIDSVMNQELQPAPPLPEAPREQEPSSRDMVVAPTMRNASPARFKSRTPPAIDRAYSPARGHLRSHSTPLPAHPVRRTSFTAANSPLKTVELPAQHPLPPPPQTPSSAQQYHPERGYFPANPYDNVIYEEPYPPRPMYRGESPAGSLRAKTPASAKESEQLPPLPEIPTPPTSAPSSPSNPAQTPALTKELEDYLESRLQTMLNQLTASMQSLSSSLSHSQKETGESLASLRTELERNGERTSLFEESITENVNNRLLGVESFLHEAETALENRYNIRVCEMDEKTGALQAEFRRIVEEERAAAETREKEIEERIRGSLDRHVAALRGENEVLRSEVEQHAEGLNAETLSLRREMEQHVDGLLAKNESLRQDVGHQVGGLQAKNDSLRQELEHHVGGLNAKAETLRRDMEGHITGLHTKTDTLRRDMEAHVTGLHVKTDSLRRDVESTREETRAETSRIDGKVIEMIRTNEDCMERTATNYEALAMAVDVRFKDLVADGKEVRELVKDLKSDVQAVELERESLAGELRAVREEVGQAVKRDELEELRKKVTAFGDEVEELQYDQRELRYLQEGMHVRVKKAFETRDWRDKTSKEESKRIMDEMANRLEKQLEELKTRQFTAKEDDAHSGVAIPSQATDLEDQLSALKAQINQVSTRTDTLAALEADLSSLKSQIDLHRASLHSDLELHRATFQSTLELHKAALAAQIETVADEAAQGHDELEGKFEAGLRATEHRIQAMLNAGARRFKKGVRRHVAKAGRQLAGSFNEVIAEHARVIDYRLSSLREDVDQYDPFMAATNTRLSIVENLSADNHNGLQSAREDIRGLLEELEYEKEVSRANTRALQSEMRSIDNLESLFYILDEQVEDLVDKEGLLAETILHVFGLEDRIGDLEAEEHRGVEGIEGVQSRVEELVKAQEYTAKKVTEKLSDVHGEIQDLKSKSETEYAAAGQCILELGARMEGAFLKVEHDMDDVTAKVARLERLAEEMEKGAAVDMEAVDMTMNEIYARLDDLSGAVCGTEEKVAGFAPGFEKVGEELSFVHAWRGDLEARITPLEALPEKVHGVENELVELRKETQFTTSRLQSCVSTIQPLQTVIFQKLNAQTSEIESLQGKHLTFSEEVTSSLSALMDTVEILKTAESALGSKMASCKSDLDKGLEDLRTSMKRGDRALAAKIEEMGEDQTAKLTALAKAVDATTEHLRADVERLDDGAATLREELERVDHARMALDADLRDEFHLILDGVEGVQKESLEFRDTVEAMRAEVLTMKDRCETLYSDTASLTTELPVLLSTHLELKETLSSHAATLDSLSSTSSKLTAADGPLKRHSQNITTLHTTLKSLQATLTATADSVTSHGAQLLALNTKMNEVTSSAGKVAKELETMREMRSKYRTMMQGLEGKTQVCACEERHRRRESREGLGAAGKVPKRKRSLVKFAV